MKNTAGSNPFAYGKPITLDTLDDLFSHHRDMLGGWHMGPDGDDGAGNGGGDGGSGGQGGGSGSGSGSGGDGGGQGGSGGSGSGSGGQGGSSGSGAGQNDDLGFPKDTPWRDMTDKQAAAYWQHQSKRHEGRVKDLVGDRTPEEIRKDLEEYQRIQREQQTPAEQALADAQEKGKKEGITTARRESATTLFRGTLEAQGVEGDDLDELVAGLNVDTFIGESGVDTKKLTNFAKRFTSDKENSGGGSGRRRDFGGGQRRNTEGQRGSGGKSEAARRFGKKSTSDE